MNTPPHSFASPAAPGQGELPPGAHLVTPRLGYLHHGIYVGNGRVIHYSGFVRRFRANVIEEVSVERFAGRRGLRVVHNPAPQFSGDSCVMRARSRLGERRYRILSNNCEHFAQWCITGIARSAQVEAWTARVHKVLSSLRLWRGPAPLAQVNRGTVSTEIFSGPLEMVR